MKNIIRWMVGWALLAAFPVMAATNAGPTAPLAGVTCNGSNCSGFPNDATHAWFFAPATGATFAVTGTFWQATQPVSIASLPLPSGGATAANQATEITSLASLVTNTSGLATASNQSTASGYLSTLATFSASASTSALQTAGNASLTTLATASASQATGAKQDTGNTSLATIATNSGTQATATNQTRVQSAPGTPQTIAVTIQGNASGVAVPVSGTVTTTPSGTQTVQGTSTGVPIVTGPPKLTAYGTLAVTASSVALSTLTVGPNSAAWSTTYPSNYVSVRNSILSAGVVYVCWLGGTCSASVGDPVAVGQSATRNVGNTVSPTLFAASTATVTGAE